FIDVEDIDSFGVCVEGYRPNDDTATVLRNWHSTAIEKRLSSSLLASHSGTIYELRGSIDRELAHQYGYPIELVTIFSNGFPENWKNVLKEYFHVVRTANPLNASHYFSMLARRRSLNTVRGQNQSCYRGERLFSIASSATLPSAILEESEHEKTENNITDSADDTEIGSQKEHLCKDSSNAASVASFKEHEDKERTSAEDSNSVM
ncbi:SANTA protein, partial [Ostertagia ostertagi]